MTVKVETPRIRDYGYFLQIGVVYDFGQVLDQASSQGCNKEGFKGVLYPLQAAMGKLNDYSIKAYDLAVDRLDSTATAAYAAANDYDHIERANTDKITNIAERMQLELAAGTDMTDGSKGFGTGYEDKKPIEPKKIEPGTDTLADKMKHVKGDDRWLGDAVDWFYRNFLSHLLHTPGKGLYDVLLTPIAGDFNRIAANGDAWGDVGDMIQDIAKNMGDNASDLTQHHWTGPAAEAFYRHIDVTWTGALAGASAVAFGIKKGFNTLSDISVKIATKCADLIEKVLEKVLSLAKKIIPAGFPAAGAAMALIEWAAHGFSKDKIPYYSDVVDIVRIIAAVIKLYGTIKKIVEGFQNYIKLADKMASTIEQIPHVQSNAGAINIATDLRQDAGAAKEQKEKIDKDVKEYDKQIDSWNKDAASATE